MGVIYLIVACAAGVVVAGVLVIHYFLKDAE